MKGGIQMTTWIPIEHTLTYIEDHLQEEIATQTLADMAHLSCFYYQRLFKRLINKTVQEYIKLRRLAKAIEDLKNTENRILDTAISYGFSDHANFTRAFKEIYHITPDEFRKKQPPLNVFLKPELSLQYTIADYNVPIIADHTVIEVQQRTLNEPEVYLGYEAEVCIAQQTPIGEGTGIDVPGQLWNKFHKTSDHLTNIHHDIALGMSYNAIPEKGVFTYFAGAKAIDETAECNDMMKISLAKGDYIICRVEAETFEELTTVALDHASRYLFGTWLSNHKLVTLPFSAEKYLIDEDGIHYLEIWVSPLPSNNDTRI